MKNLRKIGIVVFVAIVLLTIGNCVQAASDFDLEQLNFKAVLNEDGSMNVTENWQIDINDTTNTLFKTYATDANQYDSITNVTIRDVTANKELKKVNEITYHVDTDCYYGTKNSSGDFEIAWGVNRSSGKRTYEINYTVNNVINVYNDCAELYWQFIGNSFEVPAQRITGKIILPKAVKTMDNLRVWAHGPLNGEIHATSTNSVEFEISPFIADTYVEVRLAILEPDMFHLSNKTRNINKLNAIIEEETIWANQANEKREAIKRNEAIIKWIGIVGNIGIAVFFVTKIMKNIQKIKETPRLEPTVQLEYFREIPNENSNPGNAAFLYYFNKTSLNMVMPKILSATMLDLALKKYITFEVDTNQKKNKQVTVKLLEKDSGQLRENEKIIYELLAKVGNSFTMKEFEKYAQKHNGSFLSTLEKIAQKAEEENIEDKNYDKAIRKIHDKYNGWGITTFVGLAIIAIFWLAAIEGGFLPIIIATIPAVIYAFTCFDIAGRYSRINTKRNR